MVQQCAGFRLCIIRVGFSLNKRMLETFSREQLKIVNSSVEMAEEVVSDFYKMSSSQWLRSRYDVKTLTDLKTPEIVDGPFAQIVKYGGHKKDSSLGSGSFDLYKICLQDHAILHELRKQPELKLYSFLLYIVVHELVHIVRFGKFNQHFDASTKDRESEETMVHELTFEILKNIKLEGLRKIISLYHNGNIDQ